MAEDKHSKIRYTPHLFFGIIKWNDSDNFTRFKRQLIQVFTDILVSSLNLTTILNSTYSSNTACK